MIKEFIDKQIVEANTFYFPVYFDLCKHDLDFKEACLLSYLIYKEPVCTEHPIYSGYFNCNRLYFMENDLPNLISTQPSGQKNANKLNRVLESLKRKGYINYFSEANDKTSEYHTHPILGKKTYIKLNEDKIKRLFPKAVRKLPKELSEEHTNNKPIGY